MERTNQNEPSAPEAFLNAEEPIVIAMNNSVGPISER
jgi:hypothetical protein